MNDPRARPTLFVPLIGIPAFLVFFAGGLAFTRLSGTGAPYVGRVFSNELADRTKVPHGAWVEVSRLALCAGMQGGQVHVHYVRPELADCPPETGPTHVSARVCDLPPRLGCGVPREAQEAGRPRVLLVGESRDDAEARGMNGYASAAIAIIVYVALVAFSRRRRKGPARVVDERTWTLPYEAAEIPSRVRRLEGDDRFAVVDEGPGRLVFIQGYSEDAARGWGIRNPSVFPRRATLTWSSSPREPTKLALSVEEDLVWWPPALTPTMDRLARESIASTRRQIERALDVRYGGDHSR